MKINPEVEELIRRVRIATFVTVLDFWRPCWRLLKWSHETSETLKWRTELLKDIRALEAEKVMVGKSERFYAAEAARLCVRMGHEIASGEVVAAEATERQLQTCLRRSAAECERLKQLLYENEHKHNLLHRHRAVRLRKEQPDADD